jgi:hypothetical protein
MGDPKTDLLRVDTEQWVYPFEGCGLADAKWVKKQYQKKI